MDLSNIVKAVGLPNSSEDKTVDQTHEVLQVRLCIYKWMRGHEEYVKSFSKFMTLIVYHRLEIRKKNH